MSDPVRTTTAKKPTRDTYYQFIKGVQAQNAECRGASRLKLAEMKDLAIRLGFQQAGGIVTKAVKQKSVKKQNVKQEVKEEGETKRKTVKKSELTADEKKQEKKRLLRELRNIKINVGDTIEEGNIKKKQKEKLMAQMKAL